jgi:hypothetical protein
MIKKILMSGLLLLSFYSNAQEGTSSPYSFYGIGDVKFKGTIENRSMGSLGILPDSIHMNLQNPASYASLKLTTFTIGGNYNSVNLKNNSVTEKANRTTVEYLAMAFPAGKLGLSLGLIPYSSVGYKVQNLGVTAADRSSRYTGKGGVNRVFVGAGYQITPKLSAGIDFGYNFGKIETNATIFQGTQYGSREFNTSELYGLNINTGLIYQTKFRSLDVVSSLTFSPSTSLKSINLRDIATITYDSNENELINDSQAVTIPDSNLSLPSKIAFGAGIGKNRLWFVGFESTFQQSNNFENRYKATTNTTFEDASKLALGGYYIPDYNSFSNYFSKVTYRAGFRYENTGLVINNQSIKDTALTLGFGLPLGGSFSNINLGFEFGKRGTSNANLIQENYTNISIGLSFNDRWFTKRKID